MLSVQSLEDSLNPLVYSVSQTVNLLPLLTYQKIYYDSFSNSQWEKHLAYSYNVDYWDGKTQLNLAPEMLQLRYANYPKDYFMGILPNSQYGSVATLPSLLSQTDDSNRLFASSPKSAPYHGSIQNEPNTSNVTVDNQNKTNVRYATLNSDLSALLS